MKLAAMTKRILRWTGGSLVALSLLICALFVFLQTPWVRVQLANRLGAALSNPYNFEFQRLSGVLPFELRVGTITLSDDKGIFARIEKFRLKWHPAQLFHGTVDLDVLTAQQVVLHRRPEPGRKPDTPEAPVSAPPELKLPPLDIHLGALSCKRIVIHESVIGQSCTLALDARGRLGSSGPVKGDLTVRRVDREGLDAELSFERQQTGEVTARIAIDASPSGLLTLLPVPPLSDTVAVRASGAGPPGRWKGDLRLSEGARTVVQTKIGVRVAAPSVRVQLDGKARPGALSLQSGTGLQAEQLQTDFVADLEWNHDSRQGRIRDLQLKTTFAEGNVTACVDVENHTIKASASGRIPALEPLQAIVGLPLNGDCQLEGSVYGPWKRLSATIKLASRRIRVGETVLERPRLETTASMQRVQDPECRSARVEASMRAASVRNGGTTVFRDPVRVGLVGGIRWGCAVRADVERLEVQTSVGSARGRGEVRDDGSFASQFSLHGQDLRGLPAELTAVIADTVVLDGSVKGDWRRGTWTGEVSGRIANPKGLPAVVAPIIGTGVDVSAQCAKRENGDVRLASVRIDAQHGELVVDGRLQPAEKMLDLNADVKVPDVAVVPAVRQRKASGALEASLHLRGPFEAPGATLKGTVEGLHLPPLRSSRLAFTASAETLSATPTGRVKLELVRQKARLQAESRYRVTSDFVELSALRASAPGATAVNGRIHIDRTRNRVGGRIAAGAEDISWAGMLTGYETGGSFSGELKINAESRGITCMVAGHDLRLGAYAAKRIEADIELNDMKTRSGSALLEARNVQAPQVVVDAVKLRMDGDREAYTLELDGRGQIGAARDIPFRLTTAGELERAFDGRGGVLRMSHGEGRVAGLPLKWTEPLFLETEGDTVRVRWNAVDFADGHARLSLSMGPDSLSGVLRLQDLKLGELEGPQNPVSVETVNVSAEVGGSPKRPTGNVVVEAEGIRPKAELAAPNEPVTCRFSATYDDSGLALGLEAKTATESVVTGEASLPVELTLRPLNVAVRGEWSGKCVLETELAGFSHLALPATQRLGGHIRADFSLSGNTAVPNVRGEVTVNDGHYEHALTGTSLQEVELSCRMTGRTVTIEHLAATDGEGGRLRGQGALDFGVQQDEPAGKLQLELSQIRLFRLPAATGVADGNVKLSLQGRRGSLEASVTAAPVELRIPEPGPKGMSEIEVVDVRDELRVSTERAKKAAQDAAGVRDDQDTVDHDPPAGDIELDVRVSVPSRGFLRGRGLDSEWRGDLTVTGQAKTPKLGGKLQVVRGYLNFLTRRFVLDEGEITFQEVYPPRPLLDIRAVHNRESLTVILSVTGTVTDPEFALRSQPMLPRDEILARLMFGKNLTQITPLQAVKLALAVRTLTRGGVGLMEKLRRSLGLDELELMASDGGDGTVVGVGKYLAEDVHVRVERGIGSDSTEVTVEIELTPSLSLETNAGPTTQGIDLKWQYSY